MNDDTERDERDTDNYLARFLPEDWRNIYTIRRNTDNFTIIDAIRYALAQTAKAIRSPAAPDLLAACEFAAEQMNHYGNTANWPTDMPMEYGEAINRLRSAIAKAKEA